MHGNEVVGKELLLRLIVFLCDEWIAGNNLVTYLLKNTRIHIMPTMNPDGWQKAYEEFKVYDLFLVKGSLLEFDLMKFKFTILLYYYSITVLSRDIKPKMDQIHATFICSLYSGLEITNSQPFFTFCQCFFFS